MTNTSALIEFAQEQILLYAVEVCICNLKNLMLILAILKFQCPPKSFEVFSTNETFKLIKLFSELFLKHAVLLRAVTAENAVVSIKVDRPKVTKKKNNK